MEIGPVRAEGEPSSVSLRSRPRFRWTVGEVSGALGDLGTFLPHIIGAITVVGMAPAGILTTFGLFYMAGGAFYGLPIAVQPMKAASAAVLIQPLDPGSVAGAGLVLGLVFLVVGVSGLVGRIARIVPSLVTAGLQLGLGLSLAALGIRLLETDLFLGLAVSGLMLVLLSNSSIPAALIALIVGTAAGQILGSAPPFPAPTFGLHLPPLVMPDWEQMVRGIEYAVLPQIPLTLTNAIIVTAAVTRELFPNEVHAVSERNLAITTGLGNLFGAPFGRIPHVPWRGWHCRPLPFRRAHCDGAGPDRLDIRFARRALGRQRLCAATRHSRCRAWRLAVVLRHRLGTIVKAASVSRNRAILGPAIGCDRRHPEPGHRLRNRPATCPRPETRLAAVIDFGALTPARCG